MYKRNIIIIIFVFVITIFLGGCFQDPNPVEGYLRYATDYEMITVEKSKTEEGMYTIRQYYFNDNEWMLNNLEECPPEAIDYRVDKMIKGK